MITFERILENREELLAWREKYINAQGYTEVKLLYRKGKYVATYVKEKLSPEAMIQCGYVKPKKKAKAA